MKMRAETVASSVLREHGFSTANLFAIGDAVGLALWAAFCRGGRW